MARVTNQPHRFPGRAEASFYLWTDGDPLYIPAQLLRQKIVPLMSPIETDFVSEEATTDTETEWRGRHLFPCCLPRAKLFLAGFPVIHNRRRIVCTNTASGQALFFLAHQMRRRNAVSLNGRKVLNPLPDADALRIEFPALQQGIENSVPRHRVRPGRGGPLSIAAIGCEVGIDEPLHEITLSALQSVRRSLMRNDASAHSAQAVVSAG